MFPIIPYPSAMGRDGLNKGIERYSRLEHRKNFAKVAHILQIFIGKGDWILNKEAQWLNAY